MSQNTNARVIRKKNKSIVVTRIDRRNQERRARALRMAKQAGIHAGQAPDRAAMMVKPTASVTGWRCRLCSKRKVFKTADDLINHARAKHAGVPPQTKSAPR